jgi:hypothetical protein
MNVGFLSNLLPPNHVTRKNPKMQLQPPKIHAILTKRMSSK